MNSSRFESPLTTLPSVGVALVKAMQTQSPKPPAQHKTRAERMWLWIKDHPGITLGRLTQDLKITGTSEVTYMVRAGLIRFEERTKVKNTSGRGTIRHYYVKSKEFTSEGLYETRYINVNPRKPVSEVYSDHGGGSVLDPSHIQAPLKPLAPLAPAPAPAPVQVKFAPPQPATVAVDAQFNVENLTIGQARALYSQLRKMFGNLEN